MSTSRVTTANPYEKAFGYSRAIRRGQFIYVSGTTSIDPETGILLYPSSAYAQAMQIFREIIRAVDALGGNGKHDVMRVRMFVRRGEDTDEVGRALKESMTARAMGGPTATMIVGAQFVDGEMLVEIEADAQLVE